MRRVESDAVKTVEQVDMHRAATTSR
eukprot:SAG11_NODE_32037_length_287_cov_0.473404_1_plen_25_part_01